MSFITKRERVFNEYDLFDLPARNEGKLKAYASCTDARAWSHFCSDKTEHLVEIIKRNNDTCRPKYVPTDVIVNTLMVAKNAEIARLKQRIGEFEQMLAAYDQLELTCDQKCEIANAHAAIKAANKELDDLYLDLDLSGFTEGIDSEAFETGKSRGDEWSFDIDPPRKMETKSNQIDLPCPCDASTLAIDPRIDEMQETIIAKDARLSAMQNTIAVMENDVCEPYCIYAHIYTALEKIFATLCQNDKYKQYLGLLIAGKDTRCIDLKGKILFKLKVLEKFSLALIAPCSQDLNLSNQDCSCYRAEIVTHIETTFALTSAESKKPRLDDKRAQLVADIMENEEMKEILSKESLNGKHEKENIDNGFVIDNYCINAENLKRLKILQENFDDLMTCYESVKHEKECLQMKYNKYEELERELESLRRQLMEYNSLWNEKEHYKKRSIDLDSLKEKYLVLSEETSNLEVQLKAEAEINNIKSSAIEDLRSENVLLEKKLNDTVIVFEREKNALQCKLKESECKIMCQEQQINSLSLQIDRLLEQDQNKGFINERELDTIVLYDEIESLKEQIRNLKDALICNEEEKQQLQDEFRNNLQLINKLKLEIEDWKSTNEKTLQRNEHLEKYTESFQDEVHRLVEENRILSQDLEEKSTAIGNLINVINGKSQEVQRVTDELDKKNTENLELYRQLHNLRETYNSSFTSLENEKNQTIKSLQLARQESQELLDKVKDYNDMVNKQKDLTKSLDMQAENYDELKTMFSSSIEENKNLENHNAILKQEMQRLREINNYAVTNINSLKEEKNQYQQSLELSRKESEILETKLIKFEDLSKQFHDLQKAHNKLSEEKLRLENELDVTSFELETAINSVQLSRKESEELLDKLHKSDYMKQELNKLNKAYHKISIENQNMQKELIDKKKEVENLLDAINKLKIQNDVLLQKSEDTSKLTSELAQFKIDYNELLSEKAIVQTEYLNMNDQINNLNYMLENKREENRELIAQIKTLEEKQVIAHNNISFLQKENMAVHNTLDVIQTESLELINKLKYYDTLENEFNTLKRAHDEIKIEKEKLQIELDVQVTNLKRIENENYDLNSQSQNLITHSEDLEQALIKARTELITKTEPIKESYSDLIKQITEFRNEKTINQNKIRNLMDKIDELENVIANLSEEVLARNGKIVILENHINELEDEIRSLHATLENIMDTSEQIKDNSYQKIDQSLKKMEAHHSRAAHNIQMELAKLSNENKLLEEELSTSKIITEKSSEERNNYWLQIINLQNEREIIVTDIKQLELKAVGDSSLSPNNCSIEEILNSIDRIQKSLETYSNKSVSLEQTLVKVQTSSQLLLSKADEAKKIIEQKKIKIISEKEEAIKQKINMEKQLFELKERLEKQISNDQDIIKDLEAEIQNQKLIIDKINHSRQSYISKLDKDMQALQDLYQNSIRKVKELQEQVQCMSDEKNDQLNIITKANYDLEEKSKEISILQRELEQLKLKPNNNIGTQVLLPEIKQNMGSQTDKEIYSGYDNTYNDINLTNDDKIKRNNELNNLLNDKKNYDVIPKPQSINEVQVLAANVEPSFDYVRNSYKKYKLKQLSPCNVEYYSISCLSENTESHQSPTFSKMSDPLYRESPEITTQKTDDADVSNPTFNFVDIYNKHSMHTNSSKFIEYETKSSIQLNNCFNETNRTSENVRKHSFNNHPNEASFDSTSHMSADKDLFVIYRDSVSNNSYSNKTYKDNVSWSINEQSQTFIKNQTIDSAGKNQISKRQSKKNDEVNVESSISLKDGDINCFYSKPKLNINMPRIETESPLVITTSDEDIKPLLSSTLSLYSPTNYHSTSDTNIKLKKNVTNIPVASLPTVSNENIENKLKIYSNSNIINPHTVKRKYLNKSVDVKNTKTNEINQDKAKNDIITIQEKKIKSRVSVKHQKDHSSSQHQLLRVGAGVLHVKSNKNPPKHKLNDNKLYTPGSFGLDFILDTVERETDPNSTKTYDILKNLRKTRSDELFDHVSIREKSNSSLLRLSPSKMSSTEYRIQSSVSAGKSSNETQAKSFVEQSVMVKIDTSEDYEKKIQNLTKALENIEKDYKKRIEAIKTQYDNNIKCIINEHNQGVNSIQSLHEETLQDIIKVHENEVENLRTMSIEAMRKADKLEKENKTLKSKIQNSSSFCLDAEPVRMSTPELKRRRKLRDSKTLTKTDVEAFNFKPKSRFLGPCTCSVDVNISDTIRNIFEQVDVEQRKMAEHTYLKYIANKMLTSNVDTLDAQELSFLHLKVCRAWKMKLTKEEALQKRIDSLENDLMHKQRHAQQHIAELDRKVAEERRRLQEVREAVCRSSPPDSRTMSPEPTYRVPPPPPPTADKHCRCDDAACTIDMSERRSAGDLPQASGTGLRPKRTRAETNRAVLANMDVEQRREKKLYTDELPTRLRKSHDRPSRPHKK
ncbi:hypothetical protein K1T71_002365 [Dendrolimus kikuchii]|uniref:Uncharacterized protein n=1 Tax=Dendrolimus kikuchii TaxID=765133 RepID=A0ACC1DCI0_9NEOP|nr:hypothetical protein K1T71_002365 [Dendrolimus kikuchii]